jgi:hypothetical protein
MLVVDGASIRAAAVDEINACIATAGRIKYLATRLAMLRTAA